MTEEERKAKARDRARKWRAENREQHRAYSRAWAQAHPEVVRKRLRDWYEKNTEQHRENGRRWRDANRDAYRRQSREDQKRRRVGRNQASIEYAGVLGGDPCSYCGGTTTAIDHISPLSRGGTNEWSNLTATCISCNSSKRSKSLLRFLLTDR